MKRILFPTDFSENSINALEYAANFARSANRDLVLYNLHDAFEAVSMENVSEKLNLLASEVRKSFNISCYPILEPSIGSTASNVRSKAEEYDLVIMGTNGSDTLLKFFNGSTAYNTAANSNVPILIIPVEYKASSISNIVFAYDYHHQQQLPRNQLLNWLRAININALTILKVKESESTIALPNQLPELSVEGVEGTQNEIGFKFEVVSPSPSKSIAQTLHQYMNKTSLTALCLCTQRRNSIEHLLHKSVIKEITAIASYPVFIFHN